MLDGFKQTTMTIHVYTICWNEEKILPFFIRYYEQFADKIFFYDNESTDSSRRIIEASKKGVYRSYSSENEIRDDLYKYIKNNVWKHSRGVADFVVVVDCDEFVRSKRGLRRDLSLLKTFGVTYIRAQGFDMVTEELDWNSSLQITDIVKNGFPFSRMNKTCIFNPNAIQEINYSAGAHNCYPKGRKRKFDGNFMNGLLGVNIKLLHYKEMGLDYLMARVEMLKNRLSDYNKENNYGSHYLRTREEFKAEFDKALSIAKKVF